MSECELCECRGYCEWRLDNEVSCDDIKAEFEQMKGSDDGKDCHKPESEYYRAYCEERREKTYCEGCQFWW